MRGLRVGIAEVDFTPRVGLPLLGNFRDEYGARGVHDPLVARAMVFGGSGRLNPAWTPGRNDIGAGRKVALLSLDICMLDRSNVALMRESVASQCDIRAEDIFVAATHTHSGPAPMKLGSLPKADDGDVEAFLTKAATAVLLANENMKDAKLGVGHATEDRLSFNRRLRCKDGTTHMNWEGLAADFVVEPLGPVDPQVTALSIEQTGRPRAAAVNFGLHPAILAGDNRLYSADFPGYLAEAMSRLFVPDFVTMFLNGCCGNVNHIDYRDPTQGRGYQMTQRVGHMLAVAAHEAIAGRRILEGDCVDASSERVRLDRLRIDEQERQRCQNVLENVEKNPSRGQVDGLPDEYYAHARLAMYRERDAPDAVEVMAIRIGDLGIVGLPGEVFCEFGMEIKAHSPAKYTMVVELANEAIGYIPTREAFDQGGYEPTPGTAKYEKDSGERLVASALAQLTNLFQK